MNILEKKLRLPLFTIFNMMNVEDFNFTIIFCLNAFKKFVKWRFFFLYSYQLFKEYIY